MFIGNPGIVRHLETGLCVTTKIQTQKIRGTFPNSKKTRDCHDKSKNFSCILEYMSIVLLDRKKEMFYKTIEGVEKWHEF